MAASPPAALSAYRHLLRATRIAFRGDFPVLHAARAEARKHFDENRVLGTDTPTKIQHAVETAEILRRNVVQGRRVESLNEQGEKVESYELRIHDHIERGDNESIKMAGRDSGNVGKPCS